MVGGPTNRNGRLVHKQVPDSKTMLAQRWTNYGTVGIPLALGEHSWANVGPMLCNRHNLQVNEVQCANVGPMLVQ